MTRDHMMGWTGSRLTLALVDEEANLLRWVHEMHRRQERDLVLGPVKPWPLGVPARAKRPPLPLPDVPGVPNLYDNVGLIADINRQAWRLDACQASPCNSAKSNLTSLQLHSATCPSSK